MLLFWKKICVLFREACKCQEWAGQTHTIVIIISQQIVNNLLTRNSVSVSSCQIEVLCVLCDGAILRAAVWDSLILSNAESSASVRSAGLPPPLPPRPPRSPGTPRAASAALRSPPRPPSAPPRWRAAGPSAYSSARSRTDPERSERRKAENVQCLSFFPWRPEDSFRLNSRVYF